MRELRVKETNDVNHLAMPHLPGIDSFNVSPIIPDEMEGWREHRK